MEGGIYKLKLGSFNIVCDKKVVKLVQYVDCNNMMFSQLKKSTFSDEVAKQLQEYFEKKRQSFDISFSLDGSDFQKRVWQELLNIPYGQTRSYKEIAKNIGNEKAARAVGNANNKNPIMIIVPCHRVIGSNKTLVGYAYGLELKRQLLELEK